jgi:malto-oligosyltrehalose synthase/4-alpha-glucanotransferase
MFNPVSTYRIQFHQDFTFNHLESIIPYLEKLGIGTLYASPIFKAVPGSMHGYDGVDPLQINPEIGTIEQLRSISKKLKAKGISWLQDIVPNHVAYHPDNAWLMDVLEKGTLSRYHSFFDQNITDNLYKGPIMVPFLGSPLADVIKNGELNIAWHNGQLVFDYMGNRWPLSPASYGQVLSTITTNRPAEVATLLALVVKLSVIDKPNHYALATDELKQQLTVWIKNKGVNNYFTRCINLINKDKALLQELANVQHYRLCSWQETDHTINYRRFFTVNGLICLNIHQPEVFNQFHQLIGALVKEGIFQGLRVDHIDGLYDPEKYMQQLRELAGKDTYIVVEKILEPGEAMPAQWPIQGNTGYDFLALVNNLLTGKNGEAILNQFYQKMVGETDSVPQQVNAKKRYILTQHMGGEWDNLTHYFLNLKLAKEKDVTRIPFNDLKQAIGEFLIACPVYRFYGNRFPLADEEAKSVQSIFTQIKNDRPELSPAVALLENALLKEHKKNDHNHRALQFYQRCMQFTGPLMAKGVEDTLMYTDNHFIAHNEVGDSPDTFGISVKNFHQQMLNRQQHWPLGMNSTATHDTKRGEDVRARLQALPDVVEEYIQTIQSWQNLNPDLKQDNQPDANDEYFIYQTLIGAYPMPGADDSDFDARLAQYLEKTLREGKQNSNWAQPNEVYEAAAKHFAQKLTNKNTPFWNSFQNFHQKVADYGIVNSLAQVLLKFTCPGVPDVYQGCEHWDLSLVDPDNRRPVDYALRKKLLSATPAVIDEASTYKLWQNRLNGQVKVWLTQLLATERKKQPLLFAGGDYLPLQVEGKYKNHVLAYARKDKRNWFIIALPLNIAVLCSMQKAEITAINWEDTQIVLPADAPADFEDLLLNTTGSIQQAIAIQSLFNHLPFAFLKLGQPESKRKAGILLAVSSLPSPFGIGDFGPGARAFADILHRTNQKYWQLLPLSPVSVKNQYSPYSTYASFAGSEWYISPELLVDEGLLTQEVIDQYIIANTSQTDYPNAERIKQQLFHIAWDNYKKGLAPHLTDDYNTFCKQETYWLNDYTLYAELKKYYGDQPWYTWHNEYKLRDPKALKSFAKQHADAIAKCQWLQFIFTRQWEQLKSYSNQLGIQLFGDLPFYVSYDSADVWANPELFSLDANGAVQMVAGVPPDYFNADGQLWGMPVFNWEALKKGKFEWWINRIKKNLQYFDLLRLDHFRAFSTYWAVSAGETTAINGSWEKAPGNDLFKALKKELGDTLPLVSEDLGDIDDAVYALRDQFGLPGMKVLQFAFGDDMGSSPHIPHNYAENFIAYTGTHDNNTAIGWYNQDVDKAARKRIKQYTGVKPQPENISKQLIKLALASVAQTVIIPLADWIELDESARMNTPAVIENNWLWRLKPKNLKDIPQKRIKKWMERYGRV